MDITVALIGNPNSGKTTLFNNLTGSYQYVGNWPGVTVEKKTGEYRKDKSIKFTDLPGIYSLSPYTLEEVVSRDYLLNEKPDVIIDVVDASNIERNLYLATQLSEIGIPLVLAFNMMDVVRKNKDEIDTKKIEKELGCKIVEISALRNENIQELIETAKSLAEKSIENKNMESFSTEVEDYIDEIITSVDSLKDNPAKRWLAVKLFERDEKIRDETAISDDEIAKVEAIIDKAEEEFDDDGESIITDQRYNFVTKITEVSVKKGRSGLSKSDKIDKIVTNRFLAIPIFAIIMWFVYYISVGVVGGPVNDFWADEFLGETVPAAASGFLSSVGVSDALTSLISDGIIAGVGAVLGFLPVIVCLFFLISILEDVGYMARIAFILDRVFRRFGLSGKSFIPILIGTGCSVPGIMGTRTIENDKDRRMTIIVASFMPCGAKTDIIAMFAALFAGVWWYSVIWYFGGIVAVIVSGLILKKTSIFSGDPAPFIMELPEYHMPSMKNVLKATYNRAKAFIIKAGTVILLCTVAIWFLSNISIYGEFMQFEDASTHSILSFIGTKLSVIFAPLGFGDWMATVATLLGLVAKEAVVSTYGVAAGLGEVAARDASLSTFIASKFTTASILSFMFFNQLTVPCFAAVGAIKEEMADKKWFRFAIGYQLVFSYTVSLMIYQFSRVLIDGQAFNLGTAVAVVILAAYLYLIFRPARKASDRLGVSSRAF
jgi:ferrous iron transport protein B